MLNRQTQCLASHDSLSPNACDSLNAKMSSAPTSSTSNPVMSSIPCVHSARHLGGPHQPGTALASICLTSRTEMGETFARCQPPYPALFRTPAKTRTMVIHLDMSPPDMVHPPIHMSSTSCRRRRSVGCTRAMEEWYRDLHVSLALAPLDSLQRTLFNYKL